MMFIVAGALETVFSSKTAKRKFMQDLPARGPSFRLAGVFYQTMSFRLVGMGSFLDFFHVDQHFQACSSDDNGGGAGRFRNSCGNSGLLSSPQDLRAPKYIWLKDVKVRCGSHMYMHFS